MILRYLIEASNYYIYCFHCAGYYNVMIYMKTRTIDDTKLLKIDVIFDWLTLLRLRSFARGQF